MRPRESDVVFVVDEDAGSNAVKGVLSAGGKAVLLTDHSPCGTPDTVWLHQVSQWGHAIITRDFSMRHVEAEREALKTCGCHVFVLRCGGARFNELQEIVRLHHATMVKYVTRYATPFVAHVTAKSVNPRCELVRWADVKRDR